MSEFLLTEHERQLLLDVAERSIDHGVVFGRPVTVDPQQYPPALRGQRASFITLRIAERLRGCIGSMRAQRALVEDVAKNAFGAACRDPRFPALSASEIALVSMSVSVLGEPTTVPVSSERDLVEQMQSGKAGWILQHGEKRGLLLPAVWDSVPDAREFLKHLKHKAKLASEFWSAEIVVERFSAHTFGRPAAE